MNEMWYMDTILKRCVSVLLYYDHRAKMYFANVIHFDGDSVKLWGATPHALNVELIKETNGGVMPDGA